jgi:hypothetical protein
MAITTDLKIQEYNITVPAVYIRISNMKFNFPRDKFVDLEIEEYSNTEARTAGKRAGLKFLSMPIESFGSNTIFSKNALISKAYTYLKTLPQYKNAVDC